jgi:hypothetical protein
MSELLHKWRRLSAKFDNFRHTYTSPYEKVKRKHILKQYIIFFNLEPTLCQCGCAKERGLVGIKIQGDYQLHSVELARKMAETE